MEEGKSWRKGKDGGWGKCKSCRIQGKDGGKEKLEEGELGRKETMEEGELWRKEKMEEGER